MLNQDITKLSNEEQSQILNMAEQIARYRLSNMEEFSSTDEAKRIVCAALRNQHHESFYVAFLNTQHKLIDFVEMFKGTIDQCAVFPREVAKSALELNARAVALVHNHPSGEAQPSLADIAITDRLVSGLDLLDIRVIDHLIIAGANTYSMAEHGQV